MSEARWAIPSAWEWTSTGEISTIVGGGTPTAYDESNFAQDGVAWLTPADLTGYRQAYIAKGRRDLSQKGLRTSAARLLPAGTVLFSSRAPIGYCVIASADISTNQGFKSFVLKGEIVPEYLRFYLLASVDYADSKASGTTFRELSGSRAAELAVPVAPVTEQKRIVSKIDSLSANSARARDRVGHIPRLVEKYKQALLAAAFDGRLTKTQNESWPKPQPLSDVTSSTFYGPRIAKDAYVLSGTPTLRTTDITSWGRLLPKDPPQVSLKNEDYLKWKFEDGDLMVTRTGATIGKCAVYEATMGPAVPSAYLIRVRMDLERVMPRYAALFLLSPEGQKQLLDGRTAVAQPNINAHAITSVLLPLPPPYVQQAIIDKVDATFAWIDRLAAEATSARKLIDHLDQAVLAKAFRGELVPQDPNDEPASVLLERIRAERAGAPVVKRGRRTRA